MSKKEEKAQNIFRQLWTELEKLWKEDEPVERALSMHDIFGKVWGKVEERYPMAYLHDIFADSDGSLFAILSQEERLYRTPVAIQENMIDLGEWVEVVQEFRPIAERTRTQIVRQTDGRVRWFSISATSVLNRENEIDSQALFDSFIAHAKETGQYPYRTFYHMGEHFRTGQATHLFRDGNCYITSGLYEDNELARAEIKALESNPDYWGESIGYKPTLPPELHQVGGVKIPVYRAGINTEISIVPKKDAANLFTLVRTEVQRMLTGKAFDAFVELMEGDEEKARKWLQDYPDTTNRAIKQAGLITRSQDEGEAEQLPLEEQPGVEVDDALLSEIVRQTTESESFTGFGQQLNEITDAIQAVITAQESLQKALETHQADVTTRLAKLERGKEKERAEWAADLPAKANVTRVTMKSRFQQEPEEKLETSSDRAAKTLEKLPSY